MEKFSFFRKVIALIVMALFISPAAFSQTGLDCTPYFNYFPDTEVGSQSSAVSVDIIYNGTLSPAFVAVSITAPAGFKVSKTLTGTYGNSISYSSSELSNLTKTFYVKFVPLAEQNYDGFFTIRQGASNYLSYPDILEDGDEGYANNLLYVNGVGVPPAIPDINITDAFGTAIPNNQDSSKVANNTYFGESGIAVSKTYRVNNTGSGALSVTGLSISGGSGKFTVTEGLDASIAVGDYDDFTVTFDPASEAGYYKATVLVYSDDADESPYNFVISAKGLAPEIRIEGNTVEIPNDPTFSNTPSASNYTAFGDVPLGSSLERSFVIKNIGQSTLTLDNDGSGAVVKIGGTGAANFSVTAIPATSIAKNAATSFKITYTPGSSAATHIAEVSIHNNDFDEDPYRFVIQGTGARSNNSDIIADPFFAYPENIDYLSYQQSDMATNGTTDALKIAEFQIRDGGVLNNDADAIETKLTAIAFQIVNSANIRQLALCSPDGTTVYSAKTIAGGSVSFTGLNDVGLTAADDNNQTFAVYASFKTSVTDNQQLRLSVLSATASGSAFSSADAGGTQTLIEGDFNRIEVTATSLSFNTLSNAGVGLALSPQPEVTAVDVNDVRDLDFISTVTLSTSPALAVAGNTASPSSGLAVFTSFSINNTASGVTVLASGGGLSGVSNAIDVTSSSASTIVGGGGEASDVDYYSYRASTISSTSDAVRVWTFLVRDGGGSADPDGVPTIVNYLRITKGSGNNIANWGAAIKKAAIFSGSTKMAEVTVTNADYIEFSAFLTNLTAPDDAAGAFDLYLTFENVQTDNSYFQFQISNDNVGITNNSSGFTTFSATSASATGENQIEVIASKLVFTKQPPAVAAVGVALAPQPVVTAMDANNNKDADYTDLSGFTLTNSAGLAMANEPVEVINGVCLFANFMFTQAGADVTLTASATGLTSGVSTAIDIETQNTWNASSGNWSDPTKWSAGSVPSSTMDVAIASGSVVVDVVAACKDITIYPGARVTVDIGASLAVEDLFIKAPGAGPDENDPSGSLIDLGTLTVTGETSYEVYLKPGQAAMWHDIAFPIPGMTLNDVFPHEAGIYYKWYDESANGGAGPNWYNISSAFFDLDSKNAYSAWYTSGGKSIYFTKSGAPRTGTITHNINNSATGWGWNLEGNPYPSAISWNALTKNNLSSTVQVWNPVSSVYTTFNGTVGTNGGSDIIPPMQGFFVQVTNGTITEKSTTLSGSIEYTNSARVHSNDLLLKGAPLLSDILRIKSFGNDRFDETLVYFTEQGVEGLDRQDATKLLSTANDVPQVYFHSEGQKLSINHLPLLSGDLAIPIGFQVGKAGQCGFSFVDIEGIDSQYDAFLEDASTGAIVDLRSNSVYHFTADAGEVNNRFVLHFVLSGLNIDPSLTPGIKIYSWQSAVYIQHANPGDQAEVFDMTGKLVYRSILSESGINRIEPPVISGIYMVRVVGKQSVFSGKVILKR